MSAKSSSSRDRPRGIRSLSCMNVGETLGAGTFGVVFMAKDGDVDVALKKIKVREDLPPPCLLFRPSQCVPVTV